MQGIGKGCFEVTNPYNQKSRLVQTRLQDTHSIVFWSKNFGPLLNGGYDRKLNQLGYHLFFNFTINAPLMELEPYVPPLADRLKQAEELARRHGPETITWRFDPVCFFYRDGHHGMANNLHDLEPIADAMAAAGIHRCVTSFVDRYAKVKKRMGSSALQLVDPPMDMKCATLLKMAATLRDRAIGLGACCEQQVLDALPPDAGISSGECIPGPLLHTLYGHDFPLKKDPGQRRKRGCTCNVAIDIGSYRQQPCYHNCLFCYANPREPQGMLSP